MTLENLLTEHRERPTDDTARRLLEWLKKETYPVLYLLHGYSDAEDTWTTVGRANVILDNLIAKDELPPLAAIFINPGFLAPESLTSQRARYSRDWEYDDIRPNFSLSV